MRVSKKRRAPARAKTTRKPSRQHLGTTVKAVKKAVGKGVRKTVHKAGKALAKVVKKIGARGPAPTRVKPARSSGAATERPSMPPRTDSGGKKPKKAQQARPVVSSGRGAAKATEGKVQRTPSTVTKLVGATVPRLSARPDGRMGAEARTSGGPPGPRQASGQTPAQASRQTARLTPRIATHATDSPVLGSNTNEPGYAPARSDPPAATSTAGSDAESRPPLPVPIASFTI